MNGDWWVDVMKTLGFPAAVTGFVLWRLNGKLDRLVDALQTLTAHLQNAETTRNQRHEDLERTLDRIERDRDRYEGIK